jgi:hypothetical protein
MIGMDDDDDRDLVEEQRLARENEIADMRELMATRQGRNIMWRNLERLGVFRTPYVGGDPHGTAFNCGAQNHGLWLYAEILTAAPEYFLTMQRENNS